MDATTSHRNNSTPWIVVAVLAVLIGGYVGAYCATVNVGALDGGEFWPVYYTRDEARTGIPTDGFDYLTFFAPIHWLDRRIRPQVWEPTP